MLEMGKREGIAASTQLNHQKYKLIHLKQRKNLNLTVKTQLLLLKVNQVKEMRKMNEKS